MEGYTDEKRLDQEILAELVDETHVAIEGEVVNASGHRDQLQRNYGFLSICGLALSVDNAWVAVGTSLNVAICKPSVWPENQRLTGDRQWRPARCALRVHHCSILLRVYWRLDS